MSQDFISAVKCVFCKRMVNAMTGDPVHPENPRIQGVSGDVCPRCLEDRQNAMLKAVLEQRASWAAQNARDREREKREGYGTVPEVK